MSSKIITLRVPEADYARLVLLAESRSVPVATLATELLTTMVADPGEPPPPAGASLIAAVKATFAGPAGPQEVARREMALNLAKVAGAGGVAAAAATRQLHVLLGGEKDAKAQLQRLFDVMSAPVRGFCPNCDAKVTPAADELSAET